MTSFCRRVIAMPTILAKERRTAREIFAQVLLLVVRGTPADGMPAGLWEVGTDSWLVSKRDRTDGRFESGVENFQPVQKQPAASIPRHRGNSRSQEETTRLEIGGTEMAGRSASHRGAETALHSFQYVRQSVEGRNLLEQANVTSGDRI